MGAKVILAVILLGFLLYGALLVGLEWSYRRAVAQLPVEEVIEHVDASPPLVAEMIWATWHGRGAIRFRTLYPWTLVRVFSGFLTSSSVDPRDPSNRVPTDLQILGSAAMYAQHELRKGQRKFYLRRQLENVVVQIWLSRHRDDAEIISYVANNVYASRGCYGIECAAQQWFGKSQAQLAPSEAAFLATLVRFGSGPHSRCPKHTLAFRNTVLTRMYANRAISRTVFDAALADALPACFVTPEATCSTQEP